MDLATEDHLQDVLMSHMLDRSMHHCSRAILQQQDLQQFLTIASGIEVELSAGAAELLKAFYIASRKVRVSMAYGIDIPIRALSSL